MGPNRRESDELIAAFEMKWPRPGEPSPPPQWRDFLLSHADDPRWAEHVVAVWCIDLELRLNRGMGPFPRARTYADTKEGERLADGDIFKLIEYEYRRCWRRGIDSATRSDYAKLFPRLALKIESDLRPTWDCPNAPCRQEGVGAEEDQQELRCPSCGFTMSRASLARALLATTVPAFGGQPILPIDAHPSANRVGDYILVEELAKGGMGVVHRGWHPHLNRFDAIKLLKPEFAGVPEARNRFLREARALAAVQHENVVPVYHAGDEDGVACLVMPFLEGMTLQRRLDLEHRIPPWEVISIGAHVASGLSAVHARQLVHRDVKPSNLWLGHPGDHKPRVLLMDFGLARLADGQDRVTEAGALAGTYPYMSPEQAADRELDGRSDLFALGCVLYKALTGTQTFRGGTPGEILRAVAETNPVPVHELMPELEGPLSDLISSLLAKDPAQRPQTAAEVAERLRNMGSADGSHGGTATRPPSPAEASGQSPPTAPRRWRPVLVGALLLLAAVAAGAALTIGGPDSPPARYAGSVDLEVGRYSLDQAKMPVRLSDPRAMPLHSGDHVKVVAEVSPPAYLYVFWIDEKGEAAPIYPWSIGKWGSRPAEHPVDRLDIKSANGNWLKITGDAEAMETVLLLARPTPLEASDEEIRGWFGKLPKVPLPVFPHDPQAKGVKARAWFEGFDLVRNEPDRGAFGVERGVGEDERENVDPLLGLQALLRTRIGSRATFTRAVSFARLGQKQGGD